MIELIAEIGQAHDGSFNILHSYIDSLAARGVSTVKFQAHIADAESSEYETFRYSFSRSDISRKEYWRRMELTERQWAEVIAHCHEVGVQFLCSPFSVAAFELLERVGCPRYKVGSGELTNSLLLHQISMTAKPTIVSTGLATLQELDDAVGLLRSGGCEVSILECTTAYPTTPDQIGLGRISALRARYGCTVGLSDHSGEIYPGLAAIALGAGVLEFHAVFHKECFGPDSSASLDLEQIALLVQGAAFLSRVNYSGDLSRDFDSGLRIAFGKSLTVRCPLLTGQILHEGHLEASKPYGRGISAADFSAVVGRTLGRDLGAGEFLNWSDLVGDGHGQD